MSPSTQYLPAAFSLAAVGAWGTSDFLGGLASKRANAFLFTALVHTSGMLAMGAAAWLTGAVFPDRASVLWAMAAGALGGSALALFYRQLARGNMGLIAPVAAVLSAAIPTLVTTFTHGFPGYRHVFGFVLAGIGVWLISRSEGGGARPEGLATAMLCGIGFAGFYLCIHQTGNASALWTATCSRWASLLVTLGIVVLGKQVSAVPGRVLTIAVAAGILDIGGSVLFVRASQIGRLDDAVVMCSLYPAITVLLARMFLHEHFSRNRTIGMVAALAAVPMIAG